MKQITQVHAKPANKPTGHELTVTLSGLNDQTHRIRKEVPDLVRRFLKHAGLTGGYVYNIVAMNRSEFFRIQPALKLKPESSGNSCSLIVRVTPDATYAGYLYSTNGGPKGLELFNALDKFTRKRYFYHDEMEIQDSAPPASVKLSPDTRNGSQSGAHEVNGSVVNRQSVEETPAGQDEPPAGDQRTGKPSLLGFSRDADNLELVKMAILELHPSGIALAEGLATAVLAKMNLKSADPRSMGGIFKAMLERKMIAVRIEYPLTYDVVGVAAPLDPTAVVTPAEPPPALAEEGKVSLLGFCDDKNNINMVKRAILELYPSGIAPADGLSVLVVSKLGLKVSPKAMSIVLRTMITKRDLIIKSQDPVTYEVVGIAELKASLPSAPPAAPAAASAPAVTSPVPPAPAPVVVMAPPAPPPQMNMIQQMDQMFKMAKELGEALAKTAEVNEQIAKVEASIAEQQSILAALLEKRKGYTFILGSADHKMARELIIRIREGKL